MTAAFAPARVVVALFLFSFPALGGSTPPFQAGGVEDGGYTISEEDRAAITAAIPDRSPVAATKPRKLLIYDVNVNYPGHKSRFHANLAFQEMGRRTGAFEVVISRDSRVFEKENLAAFDAVFFNNTVGNQFTDPRLRQNLLDYVYAGGGLMGVHGTSVAFFNWGKPGADDWRDFGLMLGGRGARHRESQETVVMKIDSPGHPLLTPFPPEGFAVTDEFFRVSDTYSRGRVRVLFSIDTGRTDLSAKPHERDDKDYPGAWVRQYGRGRVFYSTIGHNPFQFWNPTMLKFYLGAAQYVLGDLAVPTIPSARLTPGVIAHEQLGWRLGVAAYTFHRYTLFESIEKTDQAGVVYLGGLSFQKVSKDIAKNFDANLSDVELGAIRTKLDEHGIHMLTCFYARIPADEAGCRAVFEFARKMGVETLVSEPPPGSLDMIERFCDAYGINLAIHNHDKKASPDYWSPDAVMKACDGRSSRIGVCADIGYWIRAGIDPLEGIRRVGPRLMVVQMHDLNSTMPDSHDVPWGTGAGMTGGLLREIHKHAPHAPVVELEYSYNWYESMPEVTQSARFFDEIALDVSASAGR